jgi:SAM-dependent methyltransferase
MSDLLICPACRRVTPDADGTSPPTIDLHTLAADGPHLLRCENPACARAYAVVGGVAVVVADTRTLADPGTALAADLPAAVASALVADGPDDAPLARQLEHLSIYLDAQWGDCAEPPPDGVDDPLGCRALLDLVVERSAAAPVARAVELGASVGRLTRALADGADEVVALDLHLAALLRARRLLDGATLPYARRVVGRVYRDAQIVPRRSPPARGRITLVAADALDPPLVPRAFDRVLAANLLDAVARPLGLLLVLDGLVAPGGELILATPYAWTSAVVDERERFGDADPAAALRRRLTDGEGLSARYVIEDERELRWTLRRDARSHVSYRTHVLRARKTA